jgi:prepilin-type N-terminal cleavage/methylation domain-containing protein
MKNQNSKSFTLIELLIVLALIAILATVLIVTIKPGAIFSKARDTKRINDLVQLHQQILMAQAGYLYLFLIFLS